MQAVVRYGEIACESVLFAWEFETVPGEVHPELVAVGVLRQLFERQEALGKPLVGVGLTLNSTCTFGPSLVAKSSSRRIVVPSDSRKRVAVPAVECSWLMNLSSDSTVEAAAESDADGAASLTVVLVHSFHG